MASLHDSEGFLCGASLLTSEHAVTAAHCVADLLNDPSALSIVVGRNYLSNEYGGTVQQRTTTKIIIHPNYDPNTLVNDIAILQFSPLTVSSNSKLAYICLPDKNQDPVQINGNLVAIGWGIEEESGEFLSDSLQQVTVQAHSPTSTSCKRSNLTDSRVQFCAGITTGGKGKTLLFCIPSYVFTLYRHMSR